MKAALRAFLESSAHWLSAPVSQGTIETAVDLAYRLVDQGTIGLAALVRSLHRPEFAHPLRREAGRNDELNCLVELLDWALRFPSVWALSEGNNLVDLGGALQAGGTVWLEMPCSHFERLEHELVSRMVEAILLDALLSLRDVGPERNALLPPPIIITAENTAASKEDSRPEMAARNRQCLVARPPNAGRDVEQTRLGEIIFRHAADDMIMRGLKSTDFSSAYGSVEGPAQNAVENGRSTVRTGGRSPLKNNMIQPKTWTCAWKFVQKIRGLHKTPLCEERAT